MWGTCFIRRNFVLLLSARKQKREQAAVASTEVWDENKNGRVVRLAEMPARGAPVEMPVNHYP